MGDLIDRLHDQLTEQIARALRHEAGEEFTCGPQQKADFEALGQAKAVAFLEQVPAVRECWPPTCGRPMTATRPASRWTK